MHEHLLPCPFCGSRKIMPKQFKGIHFVVCKSCDADGPVKDTAEQASEAWNTRAAPKSDGE